MFVHTYIHVLWKDFILRLEDSAGMKKRQKYYAGSQSINNIKK